MDEDAEVKLVFKPKPVPWGGGGERDAPKFEHGWAQEGLNLTLIRKGEQEWKRKED